MAEKDTVEKTLIEFDSVYADAVNLALFDGQAIIQPQYLTEANPYGSYLDDEGTARGIEKDCHKKYSGGQTFTIASVFLENESEYKRDICLKLMGYTGYHYHHQISNDGKQMIEASREVPPDKKTPMKWFVYPAYPIVMNYGFTKWKSPICLSSVVNFVDGPLGDLMRKAFSDFEIPVVNLAFIPPETRKMLKSDLRLVADILWYLRTQEKLDMSWYYPEYPKAVKQLLKVLFKLPSVDAVDTLLGQKLQKGVPLNMGSLFDDDNCPVWLKAARDQGIKIGEANGFKRGEAAGFKNGEAAGFKNGEATGIRIGKATGKLEMKVQFIEQYAEDHGISLEQSCAALRTAYSDYLEAKAHLAAFAENEENL